MEIIKEGLQKIESFGNSYYQMKTFGADLNMIIMSNKDVKGNDMIPSNIINAIINSKLIFGEFSDFINKIKMNNITFNDEELTLYNHIKSSIYKENTRFDIIRTTILSEFRNKEYNTQLNDPYAKYVYDNQKEAATQIMDYICDTDTKAVTLIALPQAGKTGTFVYCTYIALTNSNNNKIYEPENIFIISGLNDIDWQEQTEKDMMPSLKNNVYHLGQLRVFNERLKVINNSKILIIIDECQIATSENQTIDKSIFNLEKELCNANHIKYIIVSATPSVVKYELDEWGDKHKIVYLNPPPTYIGFSNFINDNRIYEADLITYEFLEREFKPLLIDRFIKPKYHIIRISLKKRSELEEWIKDNNYKKEEIDSDNKIDNVNMHLDSPPEKHTFIIIKGFYRAGKRMNDKNIGIVYEYSSIINYDVTAQGLIGRFCGTNKQLNGPTAPIFFCRKETLVSYINFINEKCEYASADYYSLKLKVVDNELTKKSKSFVTKLSKVSISNKKEHNHIKPQDYIDKPKELIFEDKDFNIIIDGKDKHKIVLNIIQEKYTDIYNIIKDYRCDKCTVPTTEYSYKRHIIDARKAYKDGTLYLADINKETKEEHLNSWVIFIDHNSDPKNKTHQAYLIIYHGERRKKLLEDGKKKAKTKHKAQEISL